MKLISLLLVVFMFGCSSVKTGFNRKVLRDQVSPLKQVVTDKEIQRVLKLKPQLPKPFTLAIYLADPQLPRTRWGQVRNKWRWDEKDKAAVLALRDSLMKQKIIKDVFIMSSSTVQGNDLKSIRLAAARYGADAVLEISGIADVDKYHNMLRLSYILLITPLFVPGQEIDTIFITRAALWDVRNEYLYLTSELEINKHSTKPPAFSNELELLLESKSEGLESVVQDITSRLGKMDTN